MAEGNAFVPQGSSPPSKTRNESRGGPISLSSTAEELGHQPPGPQQGGCHAAVWGRNALPGEPAPARLVPSCTPISPRLAFRALPPSRLCPPGWKLVRLAVCISSISTVRGTASVSSCGRENKARSSQALRLSDSSDLTYNPTGRPQPPRWRLGNSLPKVPASRRQSQEGIQLVLTRGPCPWRVPSCLLPRGPQPSSVHRADWLLPAAPLPCNKETNKQLHPFLESSPCRRLHPRLRGHFLDLRVKSGTALQNVSL